MNIVQGVQEVNRRVTRLCSMVETDAMSLCSVVTSASRMAQALSKRPNRGFWMWLRLTVFAKVGLSIAWSMLENLDRRGFEGVTSWDEEMSK